MKVAYCRVSTDSEDQENSLINQRYYFEHLGVERIYADQGISGTKLKRIEFDRMLNDCGLVLIGRHWEINLKAPKSDITDILIKNTSRFCRDILGVDIVRSLRKLGININFIAENINTIDIQSELMFNILGSVNQQESVDKSKKVKFGMALGKERGILHTTGKLYGYNFDQKNNILTINKSEADIVKRMFDMYLSGIGCRRISFLLEQEGIYTRSNKAFDKSTIRCIITNEKYAGLDNRLKWHSGEVFSKLSHKIINKNYTCTPSERIPAIVSVETFDKCQKILATRSKKSKGMYFGHGVLASKVVCGLCGSPYHRNRNYDKYFYNCKKKKREGVSICGSRNITEKEIMDNITAFAADYNQIMRLRIAADSKKIDKEIIRLENEVDKDKQLEIESIKKMIIETEDKYMAVLDLATINGNDLINRKLKTLQSEIESMNKKIDELTRHNEITLKTIEEKKELRRRYLEINENDLDKPHSTDEMIGLIDKIVILPDTIKFIISNIDINCVGNVL
jgi:site-specific DNA recombinase